VPACSGAAAGSWSLALDVGQGISRAAASRDGRDQRDQRVGGGRQHDADVAVAELAQHHRSMIDGGHPLRQHTIIMPAWRPDRTSISRQTALAAGPPQRQNDQFRTPVPDPDPARAS